MAEYSKEDREAFQRKDKQQAKGFAVTQAIEVLSKGLKIEEILATADKIGNYTAKELLSSAKIPVGHPSGKSTEKKSSEMSVKAKEVLNVLVKEYTKFGEVDVEKLKAKILSLKQRYPTNLKSVPIVLKAIKPESVVRNVSE